VKGLKYVVYIYTYDERASDWRGGSPGRRGGGGGVGQVE